MRRLRGGGIFLVPVTLVALTAAAAAQTPPPRDPKPSARPAGQDSEYEARVRLLRSQVAAHPDLPGPRIALAMEQEQHGAVADAEATLLDAKRALPGNKRVAQALAALYNRAGQFEKTMAALNDLAALDPGDPAGYHLIGTYYWEKASKDPGLSPDDKRRYAEAGITAEDQALTLNPDYLDAMVYKNILLRIVANAEPDPARQRTLIAEADALRNRALERQKMLGQLPETARSIVGPMPPPPPPPPPPGGDGYAALGGLAPVRVGGNIAVPMKIKDVRPVYPVQAQEARVQGVVIIEATVGTDGRVVDAKVLRSIPLLDQAAIDAVRQWEYRPTLLNGAPVPVIMTVTVNFALQ